MRRALDAITESAALAHPPMTRPPKDVLEAVVEASQGDIRSAVNALELVCSHSLQPKPAKGQKKAISRAMLEIVSRKEHSLVLFHLMGKVLYNKRQLSSHCLSLGYLHELVGKSDPPSSKATKADVQRDLDIDRRLRDPAPLPAHLIAHSRRALREDVEVLRPASSSHARTYLITFIAQGLYSNSPIDSSLFSLYVHQNYPPYCDNLEQCAGVSDWLSWVDANGPESWMQANPHRFHIVALGTMHSLPSPVRRRGQKQFKPAFFEGLKKERESLSAVKTLQDWLYESVSACFITTYWFDYLLTQYQDPSALGGGWNKSRVILDLPRVLGCREGQDPHTIRLWTFVINMHLY